MDLSSPDVINSEVMEYFSYLNLSWPAVSQICSLTILLTTLMILEPNSTPIVWLDSSLTKTNKEQTNV